MLTLRIFLETLADTYAMVIIVYVLMSWIPIREGGTLEIVERFLARICDPYLNLFKRIIPTIGGIVDISPIIALLVLQFGVRILVGFL